MKACLQMQPEFCSREKLLHCFKRQQNEKPTSESDEVEGSMGVKNGTEESASGDLTQDSTMLEFSNINISFIKIVEWTKGSRHIRQVGVVNWRL